jgi:cold-inducible RNA-binding protein
MASRLFVGNLSFQVTEEELQQAFADFGGTTASIPVNEMGRPRGFGFVDIEEGRVPQAIAAMNGKDMYGREITVNEARPREERGGGRPRGGYGEGGGYGGEGYGDTGGDGGGGRGDRDRGRGGREKRY